MPHFWNNTDVLVVTKEELEPWYSDRNLINTIQRYKDKPYGIKRAVRACKGSPMLVLFDSLAPEIKLALGDPRKCDHILERFYKVDGGAVYFYTTYKFEDGSYLDTEYQERYITNASILKSVINLRAARESERLTKGGSLTGIGATLCSDAHSFQPTLLAKHKVQHTLPENYRRFMDTLSAFEKVGYDSLISGNHKNQKARKYTDETRNLINSMFALDKQKPTATEIHRRYDGFIAGYIEVINNNTGELYNPTEFKKLSEATVKNYLAKWENKIITHTIRGGDRQKLINQFQPSHKLKRVEFAGSIISIDDRQPPFKMANGKRVWFYMGIDLGSEAYTVWVNGETKEGIIIEFYRQMVRNYHQWGFQLPEQLEAEMSLNSSFVDTFLREGEMFKYVRIEANNARAKRIERYFGSLRYSREKDREGWVARPFAASESNQAGPKDVPTLPYNTIVDNALSDIEWWNNQPHAVHTDKSRWEVFCEMQKPGLRPTNYLGILPYIGRKTVTSCRVGTIKLHNGEYVLGSDNKVALGGNLINLMKEVEGNNIDILWLDDNDGKVLKALIFIGSRYICEAIQKPEYHRAQGEQTAEDLLARSIMSAYVATIGSYLKRGKHLLEPVTIINNTPARTKSFVMPTIRQQSVIDENHSSEILPEIQEPEYAIPYGGFVKSLDQQF